jgi:hypothetical protein
MCESGLAKPDGAWLNLFHANIHRQLVTRTLKQDARFEGHRLASLLDTLPKRLPRGG